MERTNVCLLSHVESSFQYIQAIGKLQIRTYHTGDSETTTHFDKILILNETLLKFIRDAG